ncbi:MAG: site-specific integrase [Bacteroidetes bacterium]|nr:site-specific integrase [Bacteroidota bacterium]
MASVSIILRDDKTLKNGQHPIALRFTKDRKSKYIHLKFSSSKEHWDYETNLPNRKHPIKNLKNYLKKQETKADDVRIDLEREDKDYSITEFVNRYKNESISITVFDCFDKRIEGLKKAGKIGNANVYTDTKNAVEGYYSKKSLSFTDINFGFLTKFLEHLQEKGNTPGGIGVRMRTLRALYNDAINNNYVKPEFYPFKTNFNKGGFDLSKFKSEPARKALTKEDIDKIRNLDIDYSSDLFDSWNYFLFSYYMRGMNFADIANLKWSDISGDQVSYVRAKTGKRFVIKILGPAQKIIDHYRSKSHYVFPILSERHKSPESKKNRIKKVLRKLNEDLKEIGGKAEIDMPLTSYTARHTWAMVMKNLGHSTSKISDALGHQTEEVTKSYLDSFKNDELDEMNEGIL